MSRLKYQYLIGLIVLLAASSLACSNPVSALLATETPTPTNTPTPTSTPTPTPTITPTPLPTATPTPTPVPESAITEDLQAPPGWQLDSEANTNYLDFTLAPGAKEGLDSGFEYYVNAQSYEVSGWYTVLLYESEEAAAAAGDAFDQDFAGWANINDDVTYRNDVEENYIWAIGPDMGNTYLILELVHFRCNFAFYLYITDNGRAFTDENLVVQMLTAVDISIENLADTLCP